MLQVLGCSLPRNPARKGVVLASIAEVADALLSRPNGIAPCCCGTNGPRGGHYDRTEPTSPFAATETVGTRTDGDSCCHIRRGYIISVLTGRTGSVVMMDG